MAQRQARSARYQWVLLETPMDFSPTGAAAHIFETENNLYNQKLPEDILNAQDKVYKLLFSLPAFTDRQAQLIEIMKDGKLTQLEVADLLEINQSSIAKSLQGNLDYSGEVTRRYGGMENKIITTCLKSEEFRQAAQELYELDECNKMLVLISHWFDSFEDYNDWIETPIHTEFKIPVWQVEAIQKLYVDHYRTKGTVLLKKNYLTYYKQLGFNVLGDTLAAIVKRDKDKLMKEINIMRKEKQKAYHRDYAREYERAKRRKKKAMKK